MVNLYGNRDDFMNLKINFEKLSDLMQAFYSLTNIKIIIFDEDHNVVCSYPREDCTFCRKMKSIPCLAAKCAENDLMFFNECRKAEKLVLYTCHTGLVEGCAPIRHNNQTIAYIMFGQISDLPTRETLSQNIIDTCKRYELNESEFLRAARSIRLKSYDSIMAAAKIFEACISYIILNEMLLPEHDKIIIESIEYIDTHLDDVTVESLCEYLDISRTGLYETFSKKTKTGVAAFIRDKRLTRAKSLLETTDLSVKEISQECGFDDYNYFSRVFKKRYGISPKSLKKSLGI